MLRALLVREPKRKDICGEACAFTGHRPQKLPFGFNEEDPRCIALKAVIETQIVNHIELYNVSYFISGMAMGTDIYAAEITLALRQKYPFIFLECVIPCETQTARWNLVWKKRYDHILAECNKKTVLQQLYTPDCMDRRNRYMVDRANYIIAVWNGRAGGTQNTVLYAQNLGKRVSIINPNSLTFQTF